MDRTDVLIIGLIVSTLLVGIATELYRHTKRKWGENPRGIGQIFKKKK